MKGLRDEATCRNCGRTYPSDQIDRARWCDRCRAAVVRRSLLPARLVALTGTLLLVAWIVATIGSSPRFLVGWAVLVVAVYFFLFKLTRRVAFEVIRGRGVPAPEEE